MLQEEEFITNGNWEGKHSSWGVGYQKCGLIKRSSCQSSDKADHRLRRTVGSVAVGAEG